MGNAYLMAAAGCGAVVVLGEWRHLRERKRGDLDRVSLVPWQTISLIAAAATVLLMTIAYQQS